MPDYKAMYFQLAAKVAEAREILEKAQQQGEDSYVETPSVGRADSSLTEGAKDEAP